MTKQPPLHDDSTGQAGTDIVADVLDRYDVGLPVAGRDEIVRRLFSLFIDRGPGDFCEPAGELADDQ